MTVFWMLPVQILCHLFLKIHFTIHNTRSISWTKFTLCPANPTTEYEYTNLQKSFLNTTVFYVPGNTHTNTHARVSYRTFRGDRAVTQSSLSGAADCPNYPQTESSFVLLHALAATAKSEQTQTLLRNWVWTPELSHKRWWKLNLQVNLDFCPWWCKIGRLCHAVRTKRSSI